MWIGVVGVKPRPPLNLNICKLLDGAEPLQSPGTSQKCFVCHRKAEDEASIGEAAVLAAGGKFVEGVD
jgi:hypothetical protein